MKKYKLNITVRKGFEDTPLMEQEIDNQRFSELFQIKKLSTFKEDAWVTVSLDEIPEEEKVEAEAE